MKVVFALLASTILCVSLARASSYVVNSDGTGDFPNIQAAINVAASGDTVTLADGVFTGSGNRDVTFLGKAVLLRSLSGNPAACVLDAQASVTDQHRIFSFVNAEGPNTILDGLTVRGGWEGTGYPSPAPGEEAPSSCTSLRTPRTRDPGSAVGGGIYCGAAAGPTIRNCMITGNNADFGGGLAASSNAYPTILDCVFTNNSARGDGGGIGYEFRPDSSSMTVTRCFFRTNVSGGHGGGAAIQGRNLLTDCTFTGNESEFGAGFFTCSGTTGTEFLRCTFVGNIGFSPYYPGAGGGGGT